MRTNEAARTTGPSPSLITASVRVLGALTVRPLLWALDQAMAANERWRQRQALMRLDDHLLKDIGISRAEAEGEAGKPAWRE